MEGGGHFWKTLAHEIKMCMKVLCFEISIKSCQSKRVINQIQTRFFFYSLLLSDSPYRDIIQNKTIWKQGEKQKEKMRRRCWLIKRVTWQSCIHHSQAEQKSTHASLSTLFLLCLISAFSYPYMAANACSVCLEKRENGRWCCYTPYILDTSSTLHLLLFSVAQMQYPIAHTLVSLIPKATWNMIVKHCVTPQSWSKLKYSSIPHKHARLIRPWSGLWDTTIQNLSLTHSHSSTPDSNNLFIPWEKVSIATPHPSLSLHVFRDKMRRKGVAQQFFPFTKHTHFNLLLQNVPSQAYSTLQTDISKTIETCGNSNVSILIIHLDL